MRLPNVIGTWPAFGLAGGYGATGQGHWPPEIDIFETPLNGVEDREDMLHMGENAIARDGDGSATLTRSPPPRARGD